MVLGRTVLQEFDIANEAVFTKMARYVMGEGGGVS
jgi:hypothetical protein